MTRRDLSLLLLGLGALLGVGWLYGFLITDVYESFFLDNIDYSFTNFAERLRSPDETEFMKAATRLGAGAVVVGLSLAAAAAVYALTRSIRWPAFILLCGLGGAVLDKTLKPLVGRDRPQIDPLIDIGGFSFPSGHATAVTGLWLAIALFAHLRYGRKAVWVWPIAAGVILLVDFTRVYLGVHYPTDVLAGSLLSTAWVFLCLNAMGLARSTSAE